MSTMDEAPRGDPRRATADAVLTEVFHDHYGELVGLARLLLDERGQAEEVVQEAFARTYDRWSSLRDRQDPYPYIRTVVVNLARGGLRRRAVARRNTVVVPLHAPSAEADAEVDERRRTVAAAVRALPRRQREVVTMRYFLECSTDDVARSLGISTGSVKTHLHRALSTLAETLKATT